MNITRRGFAIGVAGLLLPVAPSIVRAESLMKINPQWRRLGDTEFFLRFTRPPHVVSGDTLKITIITEGANRYLVDVPCMRAARVAGSIRSGSKVNLVYEGVEGSRWINKTEVYIARSRHEVEQGAT